MYVCVFVRIHLQEKTWYLKSGREPRTLVYTSVETAGAMTLGKTSINILLLF